MKASERMLIELFEGIYSVLTDISLVVCVKADRKLSRGVYAVLKRASFPTRLRNFYIPLFILLITDCGQSNRQKIIVGKATTEYPRHSEGDMAVLADGSYLLVYTRFVGSWGDMGEAQLVERRSKDKGETWSETKIVYRIEGWNVMSASLSISLDRKPILFFLRRDPGRPHQIIDIMMMRAEDSVATHWQTPMQINTEEGYHVVNNARIIRTSKSRLLVPFALTDDIESHYDAQRAGVYFSDDEGANWTRSNKLVAMPGYAMMEPGLIERKDGTVLMHIRTELGSVYFSESKDAGVTWEPPRASTIPSPAAPSTLSRIPSSGELIILYNPKPNVRWNGRTSLALAFSSDEGETWQSMGLVESDTSYCYSYPSITWDGEDALLTYYQWPRFSGQKNFQMTDLMFKKLEKDLLGKG